MAIDYDGANSGLFTHLGKFAKHYFAQKVDATDLDTDSSDIIDAVQKMTTGDADAIISPIRPAFLNWKDQHTARRAQLVEFATARLLDKESVIDELALADDSISAVLPALFKRMVADSKTIDDSSTAIGSTTVTPQVSGASNKGDVKASLVLDGISAPGKRYPSCPDYKDITSQLVLNETHTLVCVADSYTDGVAEGAEQFTWHGQLEDVENGVGDEASGDITGLTCLHGNTANFIANADFETFTVTNTPDSWTISAGAVTTNILSDTSSYHGTYALKLLASGGAAITLYQAPAVTLTANKRYCVSVRIKASAAVLAGTLTIKMTGTGYTEGASEKISIAFGSLPTSYTLYNFFFNAPNNIPSDFALTISWSGTPTSGKAVWLDDLAFGEVTFGGGLGLVVVRGSNPWVRNDRITFATTNDDDGLFQEFFRQAFGFQLPSSAGGSISDGLVA